MVASIRVGSVIDEHWGYSVYNYFEHLYPLKPLCDAYKEEVEEGIDKMEGGDMQSGRRPDVQ